MTEDMTTQESQYKEFDYIANGMYWFEKVSRAHEAILKNDYGLAGLLLGEMRMELIYLQKEAREQEK